MLPWSIFALTALLLLTLSAIRILLILPSKKNISKVNRPGTPCRLLVILGSGGHTAEMVSLLRKLDTKCYTHRSYIVSSGDNFSVQKARDFEASLATKQPDSLNIGSWDIVVIPRARNIHQPLWSTPATALQCLRHCFDVLAHPRASSDNKLQGVMYPDLIITNGPGTGVIVVLAALIVRFFGFPKSKGKMRSIYVESWARVKALSLSGKLLLHFVDRFIVQWESLLPATSGRGEYFGVLIE